MFLNEIYPTVGKFVYIQFKMTMFIFGRIRYNMFCYFWMYFFIHQKKNKIFNPQNKFLFKYFSRFSVNIFFKFLLALGGFICLNWFFELNVKYCTSRHLKHTTTVYKSYSYKIQENQPKTFSWLALIFFLLSGDIRK